MHTGVALAFLDPIELGFSPTARAVLQVAEAVLKDCLKASVVAWVLTFELLVGVSHTLNSSKYILACQGIK